MEKSDYDDGGDDDDGDYDGFERFIITLILNF